MRSRLNSGAYTIIEVMIVLAVTGILLASAILVISGQQQKTQFSQAIRDIESEIRDIVNDVEHGFYNNPSNFICTASGAGPQISSGTSNQGTNKDCIFIGRVIQFGVNGSNGEGFNVYDVVGQRQVSGAIGNREVTDLSEARPTAIAPSSSDGASFPDASEKKTLKYGLAVASMKYVSGSTSTNIGAVGFISTLAKFSNGNLLTGTQTVRLMPIVGSTLNAAPTSTVDAINNLDNSSPVNPDGGVIICFDSGGTDQSGIITIGSKGRELVTNLVINTGKCS